MSSVADFDKLFDVAAWLINRRGYLVIGGYLPDYEVGQVIYKLWNVEINQKGLHIHI